MSLHDDCLTIFHAYPRLVARGAALRAIAKALKAVPFAELLEAVREYARAREGQERQYTPHCSTWMNQERYADDREEWWPAVGDGQVGGQVAWHSRSERGHGQPA